MPVMPVSTTPFLVGSASLCPASGADHIYPCRLSIPMPVMPVPAPVASGWATPHTL
jgi:hypothetical protein